MSGLAPLRSDLIFIDQSMSGETSYILKDPVKQTYSRYDKEEYYVLSALDGKRNSREVAQFVNKTYDLDFTPKEIRQFVFKLEKDDLFERTEEQQNTFLYEQMREQRKSRILHAKGSFLYFRIPLVDPNDFFNIAIPYLRWLWSTPVVTASILFILSAIGILISNSAEVATNMAHTFDFANQTSWGLFGLWITVMLTIAIHELGHGLTCKHFGGECHEIGLLFLLMTPCMYCNVNDSWMFKEKRHRLYTVFAGCYFEILFACIAVYFWWLTAPGSALNVISFQIVLVAFCATMLMNLNPLMKFDGYFALSDYLEIPNLKQASKEHVSHLIKSKVLRLTEEDPDLSRRKQRILTTYGSLATIYMINMKLGMLFMAGSFLIGKFQVWGLIPTLAIAYKLYGPTVKNQVTLGQRLLEEHGEHFKRWHLSWMTGTFAIVALLVVFFVPFTSYLSVPASLKPVREAILRTTTPGYVSDLLSNKRAFFAGEAILQQENDDLKGREANNLSELRANTIHMQAALAVGRSGEIERLRRLRAKLTDEQTELARESKSLTLSAPFNGILKAELNRVEHSYLEAGTEIGTLIDPSAYEAVVGVPEADFQELRAGMNALLVLDQQPGTIFTGQITRIAPEHHMRGAGRHYAVTLTFPNAEETLREGMQGLVHVQTGKQTLFQRAGRWAKKTIRLDLQVY